jgi:hypothetical protein
MKADALSSTPQFRRAQNYRRLSLAFEVVRFY